MYRDVNMQDIDTKKIGVDTVNNLYSRLIRLVSMLDQDASFTPVMHNTKYMIQETLIEIYDYFKNMVQKKNGIVRRSLLGKSVDYGARAVITSPNYNVNSYKDAEVDFFHAGIPLANCCNLFTPFILGWVRNFLQRELEFVQQKYPIESGKNSVVFKPLKDPMTYYNDEAIQKMLENFIYSYSGRFDKIIIPTEDMEKHPFYMKMKGKEYGRHLNEDETEGGEKPDLKNDIGERFMTLTDLFFLAASDVCADKHVYITRYPITDYMGVFPIGIQVLSTYDTIPLTVNGKFYKFYPKIDLSLSPNEVATQFVDTVRFQNIFLKAMNGDYDGDQITVKGVFSQTANQEAEKIMRSKMNIIGVAGQGIRASTNETVQTLYSMTKFSK